MCVNLATGLLYNKKKLLGTQFVLRPEVYTPFTFNSSSFNTMERDWANLGALPLSLVLDKLEEHNDVWFGVVCKSWLSIANQDHQIQDPYTTHATDIHRNKI